MARGAVGLVWGLAMSLPWLAVQFAACAGLIAVAGFVLSRSADALGDAHGWGRGWVGLALPGTVTSLPEIAVTLAVLRLRALDLAIANLLGSNLFNIAVLAVDDAAYLRGPLLADAAPAHAGTAVAGMMMTGLVIIGLVMRPQGRVLRVASWVSVGLVAAYGLGAALIFLAGT